MVSRLPIRVRLTLAFAAVMAVVLVLVGVFLYVRLGDTLDDRIADDLDNRTIALAATLDPSNAIVSGDEGVAQVLAADGTVDAASATARRASLLTESQFERAQSGAITVDTSRYRLRATPVGGHVVVVGEPLDDREEALSGLLAQLLVVLPVALIVSSVLVYAVAGAALRPVEAMRRRAASITPDTPERRLPLPRAHDEVFRLGETLNEMLERLDAGLERERRFVADASHELRTPLAILKAELEVALRQPRSPEELQEAIGSAAEETDRLVRLAEDMLLVARSDRGALLVHPDEIAVDALLAEVAGRFRNGASSVGRAIEVASAPAIVLDGDRARLAQALGNLVDNALRHGTGTVRLRADQRDGTVELHVTDEGGFDPAFLPRAFERFTRADDARGGDGTGLGLAIVDVIARAHGGSAHAANVDGGGVDVWISAPRRLNGADAAVSDRPDVR
jgi:signal transduction histidine kinase